MATHELLNHSFTVEPDPFASMEDLAKDIEPDLPWADDHFLERVSGSPLNPPPSEAWWPHAPQGNSKFIEEGVFSHTYPERYWPRYFTLKEEVPYGGDPYLRSVSRHGIRFRYGDLNDLIDMLLTTPYTRQAYLPVWFPEDLGAPLNARRPCTLGYHFILRDGKLHVVYFIRSCDFLRHFRNDIYLTVMLQHWVLNQCAERDGESAWFGADPGSFTMHCTSLHLFRHDYQKVFG